LNSDGERSRTQTTTSNLIIFDNVSGHHLCGHLLFSIYSESTLIVLFWADRRNSLPSEHVFGFHPASQFPRGHCSFTLLHPNPFKQWHVFLHPFPKVPLSQAVIRKHMKNENEIFVNENKNCSQSAQNNTISVDSEYIKNSKWPHKWWPLILSNIIWFEVVFCVLNRSQSLFKPHFHN
jgi:hypothetical protein